jgi:fluoride exporter
VKQLLLVGLGGCIGAMARYKLSGLVLRHAETWKFPLGTFAVNISGCLAAGFLAGWAEKHSLGTEVRLFLFAGLLGGYTTFSAFGLETFHLLQKREIFLAALNAAGGVLAGVLAVWLGMKAA